MHINTAVAINPEAPLEHLVRTVQLAEELGYSHCYVGDQGFSRDVYVTLTILAASTKHIRLGPGVTQPYTRHPVATAVAIASLDEFSNGRAFLGIGAGGTRVLEPMRLRRTHPLAVCRETAQIARLLWKGEVVNYQGKYFQVTGAHVEFPCRADIELHWAARGSRMLELGGELADVVMLHGIPQFDLADAVASVQRGANKIGRQIHLQYAVSLAYDDPSRQSIRARTAVRLLDSTDKVRNKLGVTPELIRELRRVVMIEGAQVAAHLVGDDVLRHYVLEGAVDTCALNLRQLAKTNGINGFTIQVSEPTQSEPLLRYATEILSRI